MAKRKNKANSTGKADVSPPASAKGATAAEPATIPANPGSMSAPAVREISDEHLTKMRERFLRLYGELEAHEEAAKDLAKQAGEERAEAKRIREELHELRESINSGVENARQGDIFAHQQRPRQNPQGPDETAGQAHAPGPAIADKTLAEVARRGEQLLEQGGETTTAGGTASPNAFDFDESEPPPPIDPAAAGPTRIEAERDEAGA